MLPALPKTVQYATKVLVYLALSSGRHVSASEVARCVAIPPSQAAKILHYLTWRGLTRSRRGAYGGYSLRESPQEIDIGQVIQLFQPTQDDGCDSSADPLLQIWLQTGAQSQQEWQRLTIAELARRTAGRWRSPDGKPGGAAAVCDNSDPAAKYQGSQ